MSGKSKMEFEGVTEVKRRVVKPAKRDGKLSYGYIYLESDWVGEEIVLLRFNGEKK